MNRTLLITLIGFAFLVPMAWVHASLEIQEIMYDAPSTDTGHEWLEITETGTAQTDLASWKFFEANTNHALTPVSGGTMISGGGRAIIADNATTFLADFPSFSGILFDSSFSLNNDGETIALKDPSDAVISQASYTSSAGAQGDGKSIHLVSGVWTSGTATPGGAYAGGGSTSNTTTTTESETSYASDDSEDSAEVKKIPVYKLSFSVPDTVVAGAPALFEGLLTKDASTIIPGRFTWSMGDGGYRTARKLVPFEYVFAQAGIYTIVLEYYDNSFDEKPFLFAKKKITVVPSEVIIKSVASEGSVILENKTDRDINLEGWTLKNNAGTTFEIPRNTFIDAKGTMAISAGRIPFAAKEGRVHLFLPYQGSEVSVFPIVTPSEALSPAKKVSKDSLSASVVPAAVADSGWDNPEDIFNGEPVIPKAKSKGSSATNWIFGGVCVLLLGMCIALFIIIRRKQRTHHESTSSQEDDVYILED